MRGYNSWSDDAYHVDTLGATDDRGGYHWSRCHTPLGRIIYIMQVFIDKAF